MLSNTLIENLDALAIWIIIIAMLLFFGYLGFNPDRQSHEKQWHCSSESADIPESRPFEALELGAQAFILNQQEREEYSFNVISESIEQIETAIAQSQSKPNAQDGFEIFELSLKKLREWQKRLSSWESPEERSYVCFLVNIDFYLQ